MSFPATDVRNDPLGAVNRFLCWVFRRGRPRAFKRLVSLFFHVELPDLDHPVRLPHPHGVVVNSGVTLGRNVTLYQGVTLGSKRHGRHAGAPVLGDDVCVFPNAVIVGAVTIGAGAVIGPCSVVIEDVPPGAVFAGHVARALVAARHPQ